MSSCILRFALVAFLVSGCCPAPRPASAPTVPQQGGEPVSATPARTSAVVFTVFEGGLVPIACYDAAAAEWRALGACVALVPPGERARLDDGRTVTTGGPIEVTCPGPGRPFDAIRAQGLEAATGGRDPMLAFWPEQAQAEIVPFLSSTAVVTPSLEELALAETMAEQTSPEVEATPVIDQIVALDLDGDGADERLYSVNATRADVAGEFLFAGLWAALGPEPNDLRRVYRSEGLDPQGFHPLAVMDLDRDGREEYVAQLNYFQGIALTVDRLVGDQLESAALFTCGG
jgi:hypothetical protein